MVTIRRPVLLSEGEQVPRFFALIGVFFSIPTHATTNVGVFISQYPGISLETSMSPNQSHHISVGNHHDRGAQISWEYQRAWPQARWIEDVVLAPFVGIGVTGRTDPYKLYRETYRITLPLGLRVSLKFQPLDIFGQGNYEPGPLPRIQPHWHLSLSTWVVDRG